MGKVNFMVAVFSAVMLLGFAAGCDIIENEGRILVTNNSSQSHDVEFRGFGERTFAAGESDFWTVQWKTKPDEEKRIEFDVYVDGVFDTTYILYDGETSRVYNIW